MKDKTIIRILILVTLLLCGFYSLWAKSWGAFAFGCLACIIVLIYRYWMLRVWIPLSIRTHFLFELNEIKDGVIIATTGDDDWLKKILDRKRKNITIDRTKHTDSSGLKKKHQDMMARLSKIAIGKLDEAEDFILKKNYWQAYEILREANQLIMCDEK